jgi:hypothetical protein
LDLHLGSGRVNLRVLDNRLLAHNCDLLDWLLLDDGGNLMALLPATAPSLALLLLLSGELLILNLRMVKILAGVEVGSKECDVEQSMDNSENSCDLSILATMLLFFMVSVMAIILSSMSSTLMSLSLATSLLHQESSPFSG